MRTHEASSTPCALTRSLPPISGMVLPAASMLSAYATMDRAAVGSDAYRIVPRITHIDRVIIRSYFRQRRCALRPQPPDKNIRPAEPCRQWLPADLESKLSVLPAGYQRWLVGSEMLLMETATGTVIDVLRDIHTTL